MKLATQSRTDPGQLPGENNQEKREEMVNIPTIIRTLAPNAHHPRKTLEVMLAEAWSIQEVSSLEPASLGKAMGSPEWKRWEEAYIKEYKELLARGVFECFDHTIQAMLHDIVNGSRGHQPRPQRHDQPHHHLCGAQWLTLTRVSLPRTNNIQPIDLYP